MYPNLKPSQREAIIGVISPQSATTAKTTAWVDMAQWENLLGRVAVGVMTASGTVNAKLQQATDSSGTGAKDITGKAVAQFVQGTNDNQEALINLRQEELDIANNFRWVQLSITPATAASVIYGEIAGVDPRYGPADGYAATSQAQIIA